jgi:hypothetical protein
MSVIGKNKTVKNVAFKQKVQVSDTRMIGCETKVCSQIFGLIVSH